MSIIRQTYETAKQLTIEAFSAIGISPAINPEFYNCDNDIQDTQIPDETENQQEYQASEAGQETGDLKQQIDYLNKLKSDVKPASKLFMLSAKEIRLLKKRFSN